MSEKAVPFSSRKGEKKIVKSVKESLKKIIDEVWSRLSPKLAGKADKDHTHPAQTSVSGNAGTATKWQTARRMNGMTVDGSADRTNYGTCSTAAGTAAKTVSCTGFALVTGAEITIKFTVTNTAANPTLNVNGTGAKPIYYRGSAISAGYLAANRTYTFRYNGTQYELVGDIDTNTNTTYSNMTAATTSAAGKAGLVPAPAAGAQGKYLRGDGTWQTPPDTNTVYTHPTTAGNKHIPAGGSSGQILRWSAAGTAVWGADNNTTYGTGTASTSGLTKLYTETGSATDGTMTQKVQTEKLNAKQNIKRGAVGQNGSTTTNPWYKFASCTVTGAHEDRWITFAVTTGYGDASNTIGILTAHFRTNSTKVWESGELKWQVAGSGIDPAKFVIAYKNTANTSCAVELWVKIDSGYRYYHFDAISEGNRSAFGDYWRLHSLSSAGSASAPSTGFTQIASTMLTLRNPTNGNAATAAQLATARKIGDASFNGTANITLAQMGAEPLPITGTLTLTKAGWTQDTTTKLYKQTKTISGLTAKHRVDLDIDYAVEMDLPAAIRPCNNNGSFYAITAEPPTKDITVQYTLILTK